MASTAAPATQRDAALLPTLKLTRKKGLSIDPVGRNAWVVRGALDARECDAIREAADACGYSHATSRGPKFGEAHRDHGRAGYHDETLSERVWRDTGLGELLTASLPAVREGAPVGLNPALRVYRYATHEVFGSHYDDYANTDAGVTAFTFLLYLTGDEKKPVVGGETAFFPSCSDGARALFEVKPERGSRWCCARTSSVGKRSSRDAVETISNRRRVRSVSLRKTRLNSTFVIRSRDVPRTVIPPFRGLTRRLERYPDLR
jgi:hypothetical protein